ncbi:MAG TPA: hypothetical protein PLG99_11740 [Kaistiaceae bacterium]|nr:hypothetical protein [Kaistiaceae bacterium]
MAAIFLAGQGGEVRGRVAGDRGGRSAMRGMTAGARRSVDRPADEGQAKKGEGEKGTQHGHPATMIDVGRMLDRRPPRR